MQADDIKHYLEHQMLVTKDGQKVTSAEQAEADVWSIGLADGTRGLINADDLRIYIRAAIVTIEGQLSALFPFLSDSYTDPNLCQSVGYDGHGAANVSYWTAAKRNYKPLDENEVKAFVKWCERTYDYYFEILPRPMPRGLKMSAAHARRKQINNLFKQR